MMDYSFGNWVRRRRKALDFTQQQLAQRVGCSESAIYKIEADERRPSRQIAELLAHHLEIPSEQHDLFLKVARQEKSVQQLVTVPPLSVPQPVPAPSRVKTNLTLSLTSIVGREHELQMINQQLLDPACRLLTLTGPGGVGKTRLAMEVAHQLQGEFYDGVWFVPLAGTSASEFIIPAIIEALEFTFSGVIEQKQQLYNYLKEKRLLLVLDNLEQLLEGIEFLDELIGCAPGIKLLATSREPLNLRPEWVFEVQGLPVPSQVNLAALPANSSVTLFLQRAKQARVNFDPTDEDLLSIQQICKMVEGLPLGLELAASWVRILSCHEIAREIGSGIDFLTTTARDLPHRHRSIRVVIESSWNLLSQPEQHVMCRLAVFRSGITRQAAETVAGAALPIISALADKSLIRNSGSGRYDMHELVRLYALDQLIKAGELDDASNCHLDFFLCMAHEAKSELRSNNQLDWLARLDQDHDNLRAALDWCLRHEKDPGALPVVAEQDVRKALQLASDLYLFWKMRVHWSEGRKWLQRALVAAIGFPVSFERLKALDAAVLLAAEQADTHTARNIAELSLVLAGQLGDLHSIARAHYSLGLVLWKQKNYVEAQVNCQEALARFRELGDKMAVAETLQLLGRIAMNQHNLDLAQTFLLESLSLVQELEGVIEFSSILSDFGLLAYLRRDYPASLSYLEKSLKMFRQAGSISGIEMTLNRLGDIARCQDNYEEAERCYTESLVVFQESGDKDEIPSLYHNLGYISKYHADFQQALTWFRQGLAMHAETGNQAGIAECLAGVAAVFADQGQAERAARLFGSAEVLREKVGAVLWPANSIEYERSLARLRSVLDESTLSSAWESGREISTEQAVKDANL